MIASMERQRQGIAALVGLAADFTPVLGDVKAFIGSKTPLDFGLAAIGLVPGAGDLVGRIGGAAVHSLDDLAAAGSKLELSGLSVAGRSLQKHSSRPGTAFPPTAGNPATINIAAQNVVEDILTTPGSTSSVRHHARFGDVLEIRTPDGRGLRYSAAGDFIGFLEPRR